VTITTNKCIVAKKLTVFFLLICLLFSCERLQKKAKKIEDKAKSKGKELIDTVIDKARAEPTAKSFSVSEVVTDFKNDQSITEIKGIQIDMYLLYVDYCVYKGRKDRVLNAVDNIAAQRVNDYKSDDKCYTVSLSDFYHDVVSDEKNAQTQFFWNFEKLKSYEIYTCIKAPFRHYLIFDRHSDTVYHRIEELRD
jgi:hypothetical protein